MTMYNYRLDSFTHVEHLYNTTKPIRGSKIVPLGDRRRKWERYSFLDRCTPMGMDFIVDGGKQYIRYDGKRYYVPKDTDKPVKFSTGRTNSSIEGLLPRAFRHSALWELISEPHLVPVVRTRINKSAKEPYLKGIQEYVHWAWTMTPLLDNKDRTFESARKRTGT